MDKSELKILIKNEIKKITESHDEYPIKAGKLAKIFWTVLEKINYQNVIPSTSNIIEMLGALEKNPETIMNSKDTISAGLALFIMKHIFKHKLAVVYFTKTRETAYNVEETLKPCVGLFDLQIKHLDTIGDRNSYPAALAKDALFSSDTICVWSLEAISDSIENDSIELFIQKYKGHYDIGKRNLTSLLRNLQENCYPHFTFR